MMIWENVNPFQKVLVLTVLLSGVQISRVKLATISFLLEEDVTISSVYGESIRVEFNIDRRCRQLTVAGLKNSLTVAYKYTFFVVLKIKVLK